MPRPTDAFHGLAQASRLRILDALLDAPGIGLAELSTATGLHTNTLREHVRVLQDEGHVRAEIEHTGRRGRPRLRFWLIAPSEPNEVAERRLREAVRHGDLMRALLPTAETDLPVAAIHQLDALYHHLNEVGLQPEMDEEALTVELAPCRFHSLLNENAAVACRVHEELLHSLLARAGGPLVIDRVLPFVTPHSCRVHLAMQERGDAGLDDAQETGDYGSAAAPPPAG